MAGIPEDVEKAAREAMRFVDGKGAVGVIARAILAERSRAVKLARSWGATCKSIGQFEGEGVAEDIAMVIEDGIKPE